jgi:hypothetical protein
MKSEITWITPLNKNKRKLYNYEYITFLIYNAKISDNNAEFGKVPRMLAAFPRWIAREILSKRNFFDNNTLTDTLLLTTFFMLYEWTNNNYITFFIVVYEILYYIISSLLLLLCNSVTHALLFHWKFLKILHISRTQLEQSLKIHIHISNILVCLTKTRFTVPYEL